MNILRKINESPEPAAMPGVAATAGVAQLFINGAWRPATDRRTFNDINPTTRQNYAEVADGSVHDMDAAIAAAFEAQPAWAALPPAARASLLHKAASIFEASSNSSGTVMKN